MRHQHLPGFILFVSVVAVRRNDEDNYFVVKYPIDQAVFLGNLSAPTSFGLTFERFGMPCAGARVSTQFFYKLMAFWKALGSLLASLAKPSLLKSVKRISNVIAASFEHI